MYGGGAADLRAAGEEALQEIRRLEAQLSSYLPNSEVSRINRAACRRPVPVSRRVFQLIQHAAALSAHTQGAFDITVAPLMRCWGFVKGKGHWPDSAALSRARTVTGMEHLVLHEKQGALSFRKAGMSIDLGGIGKGYAIDEAALILRECGVNCALLHGGTSTITTIGAPPGAGSWRVALPVPGKLADHQAPPLAVVDLKDEALSVSAPWGKAFEKDGQTCGHVIDPRTGFPAEGAEMAAVVHESATTADALSTALLVTKPEARARACQNFNKLRVLVAYGPKRVYADGITIHVPTQTIHHHV